MPARILIADDSPLMRTSLLRLLETSSSGWKVCAQAIDGPDAIQKAIETNPDLIILDFQMPNMDGLAAAAKLAEVVPAIPIVIFTLHKSVHIDLQAKRLGVAEVIAKGDAGNLLKVVAKLLGDHPLPVPSLDNGTPA